MKALFFTHWFPTEENPLKGVFILEQAKALKAVGVEVTIIHARIESGSGFVNHKVSESELEGIPVYTIDMRGLFWKGIYVYYPIQLMLIRKVLKRIPIDIKSFDVLHSHVVHPAGAIGHRLAQEFGLPHYISEHWTGLEDYFTNGFFRSWGGEAYNNAKAIFVVSKFLKGQTSRFVNDANKVKVVPNVVPSYDFRFRPKPQGSSYYFVMVAKWNKLKRITKRPKLLLTAISEASKQLDKPVVVGIVGDGDQVPELKKFCKKLGISAEFHGFLNKSQIAREFHRADLFLHASNTETFSVVIAEALKSGTPTVASNVEAVPELIDPFSGLLVENKLSHWVEAIVKAANTPYDRKEIADAFKDRFGYEDIGEKLLEHFNADKG